MGLCEQQECVSFMYFSVQSNRASCPQGIPRDQLHWSQQAPLHLNWSIICRISRECELDLNSWKHFEFVALPLENL